MHVHICTLSKHAHRNSESYTVIPLQFKSDGVKKKKKKRPSQAKKRKHVELIDVHGSPQSSTSSALEQGGKRMKARATSTEIKAYFFVS